jgi:hypothetical protein
MTQISKRKLALGMAIFGVSLAFAAPASAQATRTFVSGVGNDADPCSRTAPCRTFSGAFNKTAPGGEINCLDPGGYGGLTINKSISIICHYTEGGSLVAGAGVNGITVNAGATDSVFLRGIDFQGATTATNGLRILAGGLVHLQDSVIRRFNAASGLGVRITPSGATQVTITNTTIANNGSGATGGGILIQPTGAGGNARVVLNNVRIQGNANTGIRVDSTGNTSAAGIQLTMSDSEVSSSGGGGIALVHAAGTNPIVAMIVDSTIANNGGTGLIGNGAGVTARVGNTTITGNVTGVNAAGGSTLSSFGTNRNLGNPTVGAANDGAFSGAIQPQS